MQAKVYIFCAVSAFLTLSSAANAQYVPPLKNDLPNAAQLKAQEAQLCAEAGASMTKMFHVPVTVSQVEVEGLWDHVRSAYSDLRGYSFVTVHATINSSVIMTCKAELTFRFDGRSTPDHLTIYHRDCDFRSTDGQPLEEESMFSDRGTQVDLAG